MIIYIILAFALGIILGIFLGRTWGNGKMGKEEGSPAGTPLITRQAENKAVHLEAILDAFHNLPIDVVATGLTNADLRKLLRVSEATVTRYLDEMEKEGKVTQHGATGQGVYYTLR